MSNPKYVRLSERGSRGICADVKGSGWSISGKDVLPFPKEQAAKSFVKQMLNSGRLEPASKAEWEEVHGEDHLIVEPEDAGHQEHKVYEEAAAQAEAAASRRTEQENAENSSDDEDEDDADEQSGEGDDEGEGSDDDSKSEETPDPPAKTPAKKTAAKKAPAKGKAKGKAKK